MQHASQRSLYTDTERAVTEKKKLKFLRDQLSSMVPYDA